MATVKYADINSLTRFKEKLEAEIPDISGKQDKIDSSHKLSSDLVDDTGHTHLFVSSSEKSTWNNKIDSSALNGYVKNTDYATSSVGGVIKVNSAYGLQVASGTLTGSTRTYAQYGTDDNTVVIDKGTLENVITGKDLTTKAYVDGLENSICAAF